MTENKAFWEWMEKNYIKAFNVFQGWNNPFNTTPPQMLIGYYIEYLAGHEIYMIMYVDETIEQYALRLEEEIEKL